MRSKALLLIGMSACFLTSAGLPAVAEEGMGTPAAKAEFAKGEASRKGGDLKSAAEAYRRAIDRDPDFVAAHEQYVFIGSLAKTNELMKQWDDSHPGPASAGAEQESGARPERDKYREEVSEKVSRELEAQYQAWARQHPDKAVYRWVRGFLNEYKDPHAAERYYREALKIDPKFAKAYNSLSLIDEVRGDLDASREDLRKAVEANPNEPAYLFYYAHKFRDIDRGQYTRLSLLVVEKFPESERAPQALYWLGHDAPDQAEKIRYLEMLKTKFPPGKSGWSSGGMMLLFEVYDQTDRPKALALAQEMVKAEPKDRNWPILASYAQAMMDAEKLLEEGQAAAGVKALEKVNLPRFADHRRLDVLRARAVDGAGDTTRAYNDLLKIVAATPTDEVQSALAGYGQKLGKDRKQMDAEILKLREVNAQSATPFSLGSYTGGKPISLADFKGRVVLLNFWYPQCGPCRGEFPYIQSVLDKYKSQGFAILAVNVHPPEDDFVLPLLKGFKLGFIPAKGNDQWAREAYKVRGEPTNFLIGADGRVWFEPKTPISSPEAQRTLELQIEALLRQANSGSTPGQ